MNKQLDRWIEEKLQSTANPKKIKTPGLEKGKKSHKKKGKFKKTF